MSDDVTLGMVDPAGVPFALRMPTKFITDRVSTAVTTPKRIWRRRVKGWRRPDNCVIVDRTSRYGNPYRVQHVGRRWQVLTPWDVIEADDERHARQIACDLFSGMVLPFLDLEPLRGKDVACTCDPADGLACHGDRLLRATRERFGS